MNISVPDEMKAFVEAQMTQEGYASASEYLRALIREAQKAGATTRDVAAALNARGIATARGGQWHATSVSNILKRA